MNSKDEIVNHPHFDWAWRWPQDHGCRVLADDETSCCHFFINIESWSKK